MDNSKHHLLLIFFAITTISTPSAALGQDANTGYEDDAGKADTRLRHWGLSVSLGSLTQQEDNGDIDSWSNEGNAFAATADWFLSKHLALTGGIYAEQTGLLTQYDADGIGKKTFWMAGIQAGAKLYVFPQKWIVQPYLEASAYTNVLNLGHNAGTYHFMSNEYPSSRIQAEYDVRCPAISLSPKLGIDVRLFSSVSLTFSADYRWGLYGSSDVNVRYAEGPNMGKTMQLRNPMNRTALSLGLKIDFPTRPVNWQRATSTLFDLLYMWISGR